MLKVTKKIQGRPGQGDQSPSFPRTETGGRAGTTHDSGLHGSLGQGFLIEARKEGGLGLSRAAAGWNFPKEVKEATSGCWDLHLWPDAWHPRDSPPATSLQCTSRPLDVNCILLLSARDTAGFTASYLLAAASHHAGVRMQIAWEVLICDSLGEPRGKRCMCFTILFRPKELCSPE